MEDLIQKIIDIELQAQEIMSDARKADSELDDRVREDARKMRDDIKNKMEAKNESLRRFENEEAGERIEKINAEASEKLSALEEKFRSNKGKWVDEIVSDIIG